MHIKHIFFDLDHTLWDFETNSDNTFRFLFKKLDLSVNLEKFLNYYKPINAHYWKLYRVEEVSKSELRYKRLKDTFDTINYAISDDLIDLIAEEYINKLPNFNKLFEGTIDLLNYLKPKYQMHIITNGFNEVQALKLKKSGIDNYFKNMISSENVGVKKPNAKIFQFALDNAKATPSESIMIGDNFEADIMGAINFGMNAIYCNFNKEPIGENILSVTELAEIKGYL